MRATRALAATVSIVAWFVLFSAIWGVSGRTAFASFIVFTDPQSFFQAAKIVSTETFDELPVGTVIGVGSATLDGITYTSANPSAQWTIFGSFGSHTLNQGNIGPTPATLTFAGGGHTDAVGFSLLPGSAFPGGNYRFDVATVSGETFTVDTGVVGAPLFRGFVSSDGIVSVTITPLEVPGGESGFDLDNVSRGVIVPVFAGTPGKSNCHGQSVSALVRQFGGLNAAAAALGYPSVRALQEAIMAFCGE